ncbi:hypothetical protein FOA43_000403 [Brettanomyces nanus]|uniref:Leucine carboxyl methyltransferase 1 n=1 Tax=Eeniella nana TaxID=13502 RepID=A0A875RX05_EENNA|nr:uncharacterized protein FOA43_000403 [Brettanomyces nanus]QPG73098.1 hypothetical protein FOA43_000403 [Brettanomyces nanus]
MHYKLMSIESEFRRLAVSRNLRKTFFNLVDYKASDNGNNIPRFGTPHVPVGALKSPVINRGTWLRTSSISMIIDDFMKQNEGENVQILSLGAGNDTRAFELLPKYHKTLQYFELDFPDSCKVKKFTILTDKRLYAKLFVEASANASQLPTDYLSFSSSDGKLDSNCYHLIPSDLRKLRKEMIPANFDWTKKTLVLSECCICYMGTEESNQLLEYLRKWLISGLFVVYEPMGGQETQDSRYGEVMVRNLKTRGIEMPNLMVYNTIEKQEARFKGFGIDLKDLVVCDLKFIYYNWIVRNSIMRISQLEMLDEIEELNLINSHYTLIVASWGNAFNCKLRRQLQQH